MSESQSLHKSGLFQARGNWPQLGQKLGRSQSLHKSGLFQGEVLGKRRRLDLTPGLNPFINQVFSKV